MINYYRIETEKGRPHEEIMDVIWRRGRDNSRTPMQWNTEVNGGFSTGSPWMKVNPNYKEINVEKQIAEPESIYHFYKAMIALRKQYEVFVYGEYALYLENHPKVYAYSRTFEGRMALVICHFGTEETQISIPKFLDGNLICILGNYPDMEKNFPEHLTLRPYETCIYLSI
jgi:alpha-glucosidase